MKRMTMFVALALFVMIGALTAAAQNSTTVRVKVPFAFTVAHSHFAPGTYVFTQTDDLLYIRNDKNGVEKVFVTSYAIGKRDENKLLEFANRNGNMHLTTVWAHGGEQGRQLLQ